MGEPSTLNSLKDTHCHAALASWSSCPDWPWRLEASHLSTRAARYSRNSQKYQEAGEFFEKSLRNPSFSVILETTRSYCKRVLDILSDARERRGEEGGRERERERKKKQERKKERVVRAPCIPQETERQKEQDRETDRRQPERKRQRKAFLICVHLLLFAACTET